MRKENFFKKRLKLIPNPQSLSSGLIPNPYPLIPEKGSIFILALWSLCLLSIFAIGLGHKVSQDINRASYFKHKPQARFLAEAAIKRAQAILADDTNTFDALNEFWSTGRYSDDDESIFKETELGGGVYSLKSSEKESDRYGLVDEERKININTASQETLERLFRLKGRAIDEAHIMAASIIDWRDIDSNPLAGGAEDNFYGQLERPYECKDANFQVLEELLLVKGMTADIFRKVKDFMTIYGDGRVNVNTAGYEALYALGLDGALVNKIMDYRKGKDAVTGTQDDNILKNQANIANDLESGAGLNAEELNKIVEITSRDLLSVSSNNFSIQAEGRLGRRRERIICVVSRDGKVKYWREY